MSTIKINHLSFSYSNSYDPIFEDVSLLFDTSWKLGLIGRNGRGKSTLIKLLSGKEKEYSGEIFSSGVLFDTFPYAVKDPSRYTYEILCEIAPNAEDWEIIRELSYLDVDAEVLYRPYKTLSNGEQTKALLAALFCNEGHFLLIDEPTNHLDYEGRRIVASYLKKKKGFLLVSHDRRFLDECVDHIISINKNDIDVVSGNYSSWKANFDARQSYEIGKNEKLTKDIKRLEEASRRTSLWSDQTEKKKSGAPDKGYIGHKAAKMMQRSKNIESRQQKAIEEKQDLLKNVEENEPLELHPLDFHSDPLITIKDLSVLYDGKEVFTPISLQINRGDRIALVGKNGCGKSSLIKLFAGKELSHSGSLEIRQGLIISYLPQDASFLKGSLSTYIQEHHFVENRFKAILRKFGFERVMFEKDMKDYSEGQKKKVLLATCLSEQAHVYLFDEPLNYLDIDSRIQIEELIKEYNPTLVFVEHDAYFRETIQTRTIEVEKR